MRLASHTNLEIQTSGPHNLHTMLLFELNLALFRKRLSTSGLENVVSEDLEWLKFQKFSGEGGMGGRGWMRRVFPIVGMGGNPPPLPKISSVDFPYQRLISPVNNNFHVISQ